MPSKSRAQQRLMQAAEHGATFPMARKLRASMTHQQLHDFAAGSEKGKPEHVRKAKPGAKGRTGRMHTFESEGGSYHFRSRANLKRGKT